MGGFHGAYNWQVAPRFLLGAEGDFGWLNTKYTLCRQTDPGNIACLDGSPDFDGFETIASQTDWLVSAHARAGVTFEKLTIYGTGRLAWENIKTMESLSCLTGRCGRSALQPAATSTVAQVNPGWVAGLASKGGRERRLVDQGRMAALRARHVKQHLYHRRYARSAVRRVVAQRALLYLPGRPEPSPARAAWNARALQALLQASTARGPGQSRASAFANLSSARPELVPAPCRLSHPRNTCTPPPAHGSRPRSRTG